MATGQAIEDMDYNEDREMIRVTIKKLSGQ